MLDKYAHKQSTSTINVFSNGIALVSKLYHRFTHLIRNVPNIDSFKNKRQNLKQRLSTTKVMFNQRQFLLQFLNDMIHLKLQIPFQDTENNTININYL